MFFFSSRRRHTRYWRDWSSDVCSSDLLHVTWEPVAEGAVAHVVVVLGEDHELPWVPVGRRRAVAAAAVGRVGAVEDERRSGGRGVGKEWRSRGRPDT